MALLEGNEPTESDEIAGQLPVPAHRPEFSLVEWYLAEMAEQEAMIEEIDARADMIKRAIQRRKDAIAYRWGPEVQLRVSADLRNKKGKSKSVSYLTGRAGYRRKQETIEFKYGDYDTELIAACEKDIPDAVRVSKRVNKGPIIEYLKKTGELPPGVKYIGPREDFYPAVGKQLSMKQIDQLLSEGGAHALAHRDQDGGQDAEAGNDGTRRLPGGGVEQPHLLQAPQKTKAPQELKEDEQPF